MYFYPVYPATIVPTLSSTLDHFTTQVLPVSFPASPPTVQVQPPTRASPVSVSASRLSALLIYLPLVPTSWLSFPVASYSLHPTNFFQVCPKLFICRPLRSPHLSPDISPLVVRISWAYFKYWSQRYLLRHGCLSCPYICHIQLCYRRFPHYFRPGHLPCPISYPLWSCPRDISKKTCVCYLYLLLHCRQHYPSIRYKK